MKWILITPELTLLMTVLLFMALSCLRTTPRRDYYTAVLMAAFVLIASIACVPMNGDLFYRAYRVDLFSQVFKSLLAIGFFLVVVLCDDFSGVAPDQQADAYLLLAACTLAMMLLVSSVHMVVIILALELSSYSLYILVFLRRERPLGMVAGLRYFWVGASASGLMLFGLALVYGGTGAVHIDTLVRVLPERMSNPLVATGLLLTFSGFFFKLAVFPFHFWAPEAYQGAPNQVAAFIAAVSKVAAVAILLRVVSLVQGNGDLLAKALIAMAVASMTLGNLAAIAQKDFKRLMAFSSVAHAGYLLIAILCMTRTGYAAALFYAAAVLIMKFTCFMVLILVAEDGRNLQISELAGLHERAPLLALALMMALFGLAGIPPTIGFSGKLMIFYAAIQQGYLALVVVAMGNVVVSLYYYLMVLKAAYLDEPDHPQSRMTLSLPARALALGTIVVIVCYGFYPTALFHLAQQAVQGLP